MVLASSQFDIFWNLLLNETELTLQIRQIPMSQNKCIYIRQAFQYLFQHLISVSKFRVRGYLELAFILEFSFGNFSHFIVNFIPEKSNIYPFLLMKEVTCQGREHFLSISNLHFLGYVFAYFSILLELAYETGYQKVLQSEFSIDFRAWFDILSLREEAFIDVLFGQSLIFFLAKEFISSCKSLHILERIFQKFARVNIFEEKLRMRS